MKNLSQSSWFPVRDSNPVPPKNEAGMLITLSLRSVAKVKSGRNFIYSSMEWKDNDSFNFILLAVCQVKANEVGWACGTHGRGEKCVQGFGGKARRKETTWNTKA
jgi:hypothetical protein